MLPSIEDTLAYEIKKEMADRYFGFRRLIEEDKHSLEEKIREHSLILEKRISFDLIRIYMLLGDENRVQKFLSLIGWNEMLYYDSYFAESLNIRQRLFAGVRIKGLTRSGRFKKLVFDAYERLEENVARYREQLAELKEEEELLNEEINQFYRSADLSSMLDFLRNLDNNVAPAEMTPAIEGDRAEALNRKLRLEETKAVEHRLPDIPSLPALHTIRRPLKKLVEAAYRQHGDRFLASLTG